MRWIKDRVLDAVRLPGATAAFAPLMKRCATVFMLHRFRDPDRTVEGHDPAMLRQALEYLRRHRYDLLDLERLFQRLGEDNGSLDRAVVFTIDDGYYDQALIATDIFAAYDCPVTTFVTTGFLDRDLWFWWDQLDFVLHHTDRHRLVLELNHSDLDLLWTEGAGWRDAFVALTALCKTVDDPVVEVVEPLATAAGVDLPNHPPNKYAAMTWAELRACEGRGMRFGPHTVTHPILSLVSDEQSHRELVESWNRLRAEVRDPVAVFCYPNGRGQDFGRREIDGLIALGLLGAVTGGPGYVQPVRHSAPATARFSISRFAFPNRLTHVIQLASGVERLKQIVRRG